MFNFLFCSCRNVSFFSPSFFHRFSAVIVGDNLITPLSEPDTFVLFFLFKSAAQVFFCLNFGVSEQANKQTERKKKKERGKEKGDPSLIFGNGVTRTP